LKNFLILLSLITTAIPAVAAEPLLRYRGHYTLVHEVNIFCPAINSQCYWISPQTSTQERTLLKQLVETNTSKPYQAICLVLEGSINRDPEARKHIGFAAEYDGLFTVNHVFGLCSETTIVTQGDLQHHRWILESINDDKLEAVNAGSRIPDIDFGEQMTVSGNSGCNRFSGRASLRDRWFSITSMMTTMMSCTPSQNQLDQKLQKLLGGDSIITIDDNKRLILEAGETRVVYHLRDWVR
jgi:heat shock protein HslJ